MKKRLLQISEANLLLKQAHLWMQPIILISYLYNVFPMALKPTKIVFIRFCSILGKILELIYNQSA